MANDVIWKTTNRKWVRGIGGYDWGRVAGAPERLAPESSWEHAVGVCGGRARPGERGPPAELGRARGGHRWAVSLGSFGPLAA